MGRWLVWNVLFRLHERAKGHATYRFLHEMEAADRMSAAELDELRRRKLRDLLEYSYAYVPYYRTRMHQKGIRPRRVRCANRFGRHQGDVRANIYRGRRGPDKVPAADACALRAGP